MVELDNIVKTFGTNQALQGITCNFSPGQITGVLGENGAGKSTLLRIMAGTLPQDTGEIRMNGVAIPADARRRAGALLFGGKSGLYEELTALENIVYFAELRGISRQVARERTRKLARTFEMEHFMNVRARNLSTGMRQKVAIARSLVHEPSLIMLDEPESGLDFAASALLNDFLREYASRGNTVIISSHSAGDILALCSTVIVLHEGKMRVRSNLAVELAHASLSDSFDFIKRLVVEA